MAIEHGGNACNVPLNYNIFLHGTSECAAVPGVVSLSHMLPETHHTPKKKKTCTNRATNFSLLAEYYRSQVINYHTSLTHVGPNLARHH